MQGVELIMHNFNHIKLDDKVGVDPNPGALADYVIGSDEFFEINNKKFDIIIEDSCHLLETQVNVIETVHSYLNPGGMLIIEDIFPLIKNKDNRGHGDYVEEELSEAIEPFKKYYSDILFIGPQHKYKYTGLYGETRMLILYK